MKIHYSKLLVKKVFLITEIGNHINVMKMLLLNVKIQWFVSEFAEMGFNDGEKIVSSLLRFLTTLLPDGKWKQERKKERKKGYERCTLNLSVVILWLLMQSEESCIWKWISCSWHSLKPDWKPLATEPFQLSFPNCGMISLPMLGWPPHCLFFKTCW